MSDRTILFIAEPQAVSSVFPTLKEAGVQAGLADTLAGALNFIKKTSPLLIFTRPAMQGYSAADLLAEAAAHEGFPPVIVFTKNGSTDEAQRFLDLGARDYWLEPLVWDKIRLILPREAPEAPAEEPEEPRPAPRPQASPRFQVIGKHQAVLRVLALARQVARSKATVLISGESGTGKEMIARFLHHHSERADQPFVAINCAALPEHLLESELFGHEKGAFTGAINRKLGKFELADGGTLLLDEITEMDLGLQAKLLRVLQEGEIDRVGGVETVRVDVRVLATTNRDIEESVREKKFRQDLFYRLNVIPIKLPRLAERGEDVLVLADFFRDKYCAAYGLSRLAFTEDAKQWLLDYEWPGNVRELQNLMERAVLLAGSGPIRPAHFLMDSESWAPEEESPAADAVPAAPRTPGEALSVMPLHEMEKALILKSLDETRGNRTQAAELLGISVRTLRNKLNEYRQQGLEID
ncbi:sigma-54 dependent transcriptional regulator [Desulfovibrio aminophilus]|nr:sigma-54 dependent transcriptional regulator [Desulfovibrio aminophilus]MCM0754782.1 sigma-54 dependent transcriptional regulator [Desulfovibrio aminophilus]